MANLQTSRNIEDLRNHLSEKLEELHRRANTATQILSPLRYWRDPVVRFGLGVVLGLALGGRRRSSGAGPEGLVRAVVRAGLMAATTSLVTRALADPRAIAKALETS